MYNRKNDRVITLKKPLPRKWNEEKICYVHVFEASLLKHDIASSRVQ